MLQGTGSDVGKTVLVAGLCRAALKRGLRVAPFKPQNMSNNAAVATIPQSDEEGEIGRGQWLQARACRIEPTTDMNPVLLKPQDAIGSQIIVQGKKWGQAKGRDYQKLKPKLLSSVLESFERLKADYDLVIVEGAGSPAEINLRAGDIANMGFATAANVPVVLVGDIDRGGVIASIVGTHTILPPDDLAMIAGYLINKFRGDVTLFDDGLTAIEGFTGWKSFGIVPWLQDAAKLPAEDSVALERLSREVARAGGIRVIVPMLDRISNFDDLDPLLNHEAFSVQFVRSGEALPDADVVIIPGSKSTIGDLAGFRRNGWDVDLQRLRDKGAEIIGICGGFQMLGREVHDPDGIEGAEISAQGLGLLDVVTVMEREKQVRTVKAWSTVHECALEGYEIHLGRTSGPDCERPTAIINELPDGAMSRDGKVWGSYLHGALLPRFFIDDAGDSATQLARIDNALDAIADKLAFHLDLDALFQLRR